MRTVSQQPGDDSPTPAATHPPFLHIDRQDHVPQQNRDQPQACAEDLEVAFSDLCDVLFTSLRRSDQRRKGMDYMRGLLETSGRKSVRNMAALIGGRGSVQSLHHFICSSTWDWTRVRQSLAQHVLRTAPPQAWVVRPMVIPKVGQNSVGVSRYFSPADGQVLNAQRAIGVWAVSDQLGTPLNWRLRLPQMWIKDDARRSQASIPPEVGPETPIDCVVAACREMRSEWGLPARPVVVDTYDSDTLATVSRLRVEGMQSVARVAGNLLLTVEDPALTGRGATTLPANQIMRAAQGMRRPVMWMGQGPEPVRRTSLVASVRVGVPALSTSRSGTVRPGGEHRLVGVWENGQQGPAELWLTDMTAAQVAVVPRLSGFFRRVDQDFTEIADQVGIRDYVGRSYGGWHRHVTLASAAHAIVAMSNTAGRQVRQAS